MVTQIGTVEKDGYGGALYENTDRGTKFVAWQLATFSTARGGSVKITGVTGEKGSPKAAAWNLQHQGNTQFLQRVLRSRIQLSRGDGGGIDVSVPGAQLQGEGYEKPLDLTLRENIASTADLDLALGMMARTIANIAAKGVYSRLNQQGNDDDAEAIEEELKF